MKYILTVLIIITIIIKSCKSSESPIEARVKKFMAESVVPTFNDPASYEFVSMTVDTFYGREYIEKLKTTYRDDSVELKKADSLNAIPGYSDRIINLHISVNYRGKNKLGALVLNELRANYYPEEDKFTVN